MKVYLVMDCIPYDGCDCVKVFDSNDRAQMFIKRCVEYNSTEEERILPQDLGMDCRIRDDNGETEYERDYMDAYGKRYDEWARLHPAGKKTCYLEVKEMVIE